MKKQIYAVATLIVTMLVAFYGILLLDSSERDRDIQNLQSQMSLVVDSRAEALNDWLQAQYAVLGALADNASLQLYVTVIGMSGADQPLEEDPAERDYLRNLLNAKAEQFGFLPERIAAKLPANTRPLATAGLALLDPTGGVIASSDGMLPIEGRLKTFLDDTPLTERGLLDLFPGRGTHPTLGFLAPVFGETEEGKTQVIARVLGLRQVDERFFGAMKQPGLTAKTAESYLIRRDGNRIQYLTPLHDGSEPLSKTLAINSERLVDVAALSEPGRFHEGLDYAANACFAVSRQILDTPWTLVHKIDRSEALAQSDADRTTLFSVLSLVLVLFGAGLIVAWRYSTSLRAEEATREAERLAQRYKESSERFESISRFLDIVTDAQPHAIFVTTSDNTLSFGNERIAEISEIPKRELEGRSLIGLLGQERGSAYNAINQQVLATGRPIRETSRFADQNGQEQVWRSFHCLLETQDGAQPRVLTTIEDLTDLMRERARRERNTRQLIETLVGLVDERDPDSAHQSRYAAQVARKIAEEMGLERPLIETADQAARLANIGKVRIPRALLTKDESLSEDELRIVRQSLDEGPNLLKEIEFDGPVVETLRQINERIDGAGRPHGLKEDAILPTAQAVAVANCFVALLSPRAFRDPKSFDEAEAILMQDIDRRFDRRAVFSLLNYLNNKGGKETWAEMTRLHGTPRPSSSRDT